MCLDVKEEKIDWQLSEDDFDLPINELAEHLIENDLEDNEDDFASKEKQSEEIIGHQNLAHVISDKDSKFKQVIVVRKDLNMTPGKLAAQVSHASMAFLTTKIRHGVEFMTDDTIDVSATFPRDMFDEWLNGTFTKIVLSAKNKNKMNKIIEAAIDSGMIEGKDFFVIRDACLTELSPEEFDENGVGWTATCVGFAPTKASVIDPITKKLQLLK